MRKSFLSFLFLSLCFVGITAVAESFSPVKLKIITVPQTIEMGTSSSVITLETQDELGNLAEATTTIHINLSTDSLTGSFSSKSATECGSDWTKTEITIASSTAHKSFCYQDSTAGEHLLTVSATGLTSDSQIIKINQPQTIDLATDTPPVIISTSTITTITPSQMIPEISETNHSGFAPGWGPNGRIVVTDEKKPMAPKIKTLVKSKWVFW